MTGRNETAWEIASDAEQVVVQPSDKSHHLTLNADGNAGVVRVVDASKDGTPGNPRVITGAAALFGAEPVRP